MRKNIGNYTLDEVAAIFENHVPQYQKLEGANGLAVEHLIIRNPEGGFYWAFYVCTGGRLYVTGDMYAAIYQWNEGVDMEWISNCDLGYFQSKATAVPAMHSVNARFQSWYEEVAKEGLERMLEDYESPLSITEALGPIRDALHNPHEWAQWLEMNNYDGGDTRLMFPDYHQLDCDFMSSIHSIGWDTSVICAQHLYGLKDAFQKLNAQKEKEQDDGGDTKDDPQEPADSHHPH